MDIAKQLEKLHLLFFHPKKFFKSVQKEKGYVPILMYFAFTVLALSIIQWLFAVPYRLKNVEMMISIFTSLFGIGFMFVYALMMPFIGSGVAHLGVVLVKGKHGFFETFKPITYSMIISFIYGTIINIIMSITYLFYPLEESVAEQGVFSNPAVLIFIGVIIAIAIASIIHTVYAEIVGLAHYQKISHGKSAIAVIVVPWVISLIIFLFIGIIALLIYVSVAKGG